MPFPRFIEAARAYRSAMGERWRVDETYLKIDGRWRYLFRAIDEHGQIIDGYLSDRRDRAAAQRVFEGAINMRGTAPTRVTTDTAKCYPPALRAILPLVQQDRSKYLNNELERDLQHLKGRIRPMRSFKTFGGACNFGRGHALIRNLRCEFSALAGSAPARLRLAAAWTAFATII